MLSGLARLKTRADFLRVAAARRRAARPGLVLQAAPRPLGSGDGEAVRIGFTASRKVGNAVVRNRVRRRLREVARLVIGQARPDLDYVLVGKRPWGLALATDEKKLYVANGLSDDVTIIDTASNAAITSVPAGQVPYGILIDDQ